MCSLYIEVIFHISYYYQGEECCSVYRELPYIEVRYIEVLLYFSSQESFSGETFLVQIRHKKTTTGLIVRPKEAILYIFS